MDEICERSERATENKKKRLGGNFKFSGCGKSSNRKDVALPAFCREKSCKIRITKIKEHNLGKLTIFGGITPFRSRSLAYFYCE